MEKRFILAFFFLIAIDILTKVYFLDKGFIIIPGILEISSVKNTGIAFGLFKGSFFFTIVLPLVAILVLSYFFYHKKNTLAQAGLTLAISGLVGNLISRFVYGYVPDFITIPFLSFIFQVFNFADLYLFAGIIVLIIFTLKVR